MKRGIVALGALVQMSAAAAAQAPVPPERPRDIPGTESPAKNEAPPYQVKLERLAELMGTLTLLRDLCPPGDGAIWRSKMQELLTSEGNTAGRRDRLAGAFNRGFDGYRFAYRTCTPAAQLVIDRALEEGGRLAREISTRFGG